LIATSNEQYAIAVWGVGALFTGLKQAGFEADHLCLSNAKFEHVLDYTSFPMCSMPSRVFNLHPIAQSTVSQALARRQSAAHHLLFILITFSLI
jgi:hypothetical protein